MADLKAVYAAIDEQAALDVWMLSVFAGTQEVPKIYQPWRTHRAKMCTYFKHPQEVR